MLEEDENLALEHRVEENRLRRLLQAIYQKQGSSSLVHESRRRLGLSGNNPVLLSIINAVDAAQAALNSLAQQLYRYVTNKVVVGQAELERYGVRVRIEAGALAAAGGPALK